MPDLGVPDFFIRALRFGGDRDFAGLGAALSDRVEFVSAVTGPTSGAESVISQLKTFQAAGRFARAVNWASRAEPPAIEVEAEFPADSFYARYVWDIALSSDGTIDRITQTGVAQTEPLQPSPVQLNAEIDRALQIARESRNPVIVAYVNEKGQPSQAPRGTVQVFSETQLAFWIHSRKGGLMKALATNKNLSLHYWGGIGTAFGGALLFQGLAHVDEDDSTRRQVYEGSPPSEQRSDPERAGAALVVDLCQVSGFLAGTRYNMVS
jgi:hypothetical protein